MIKMTLAFHATQQRLDREEAIMATGFPAGHEPAIAEMEHALDGERVLDSERALDGERVLDGERHLDPRRAPHGARSVGFSRSAGRPCLSHVKLGVR